PRWGAAIAKPFRKEPPPRPKTICHHPGGALSLFSSPDVFVAHGLAIAVACRGANHRQLDAPPAAALHHDLTSIGPLKPGDRPIARRGRVAITRQRPFVVPRFPDIPEHRQIFDWRPTQPFARITKIGLPSRRRLAHDRA